MSDVFSTAIADLLADDNLSADGTLTPTGDGAEPISLRVLKPIARPMDFSAGVSRGGGGAGVKFKILQSDVTARPQRDWRLTVGDQSYLIESSTAGANGRQWVLDVRPVSP